MSKRFKVLLEYNADDKTWVTYVPALNHLSTFGDTREEALAMTEEAILGYIVAAKKEGIELPADDFDFEVVSLEVALT